MGPHIKNNKIQKNSKTYIIKNITVKKMPERPKNAQKLIEDVQNNKNYFLTVYHWLMRALMINAKSEV